MVLNFVLCETCVDRLFWACIVYVDYLTVLSFFSLILLTHVLPALVAGVTFIGDVKPAESEVSSSRASISSLSADVASDSETVDGLDSLKQSKLKFPDITHKDAFLVFRSLCRLSMKGMESSDSK